MGPGQADLQGSRPAGLGKTRGEEEEFTLSKHYMQRIRGGNEPHIRKEQRGMEAVGDLGPGEVRQVQKWAGQMKPGWRGKSQ